ncbi:hypothetical protein [Marininema halotolerans]|uniref:Uncharacterized protein n=1 Tax=Marininema halotolerans TaxID=1155944 RepID=A0A1I6PRP5_9BACL|nr:hypothetical protein [Marininema halotolerans]SFS42856.1 hypothetical protein SAMN05444972_10289 [Marininema halotolerans]
MLEEKERALSLWKVIDQCLSNRRVAQEHGDRQAVLQLTEDIAYWQEELNHLYVQIGSWSVEQEIN